MLRHSTLSPFRLSAASAISSLKSITGAAAASSSASKDRCQQLLVGSATKRRKLSVLPSSDTKAVSAPDSDLKAAASALAVLAATTTTRTTQTTACDVKRVLLPRDVNVNTAADAATVAKASVAACPPSSKAAQEAAPQRAPHDEAKKAAAFQIGKPPLKPSSGKASAKGAVASKVGQAARLPAQPSNPLPSHAQTSVGYAAMSYYPASTHAPKPHREYHHQAHHHHPHYPPLPRAHGGASDRSSSSTTTMASNHASWMWPTMHHSHHATLHPAWSAYQSSLSHQRHHYHHHAAAAAAAAAAVSSSGSASNAGSVNLYARAQNKPSSTSGNSVTSFNLPPADKATFSAIAALPVKHDNNTNKGDREWTAEDDRRLAQLVSDYKNRSRPQVAPQAAGSKRSFDALIEASASMEEERLPPKSILVDDSTTSIVGESKTSTTISHPPAVAEDVDDANLSCFAAKVVRRKRTTWAEDEDKELSRVVEALRAETDKVCWSTVMKMMPGRDSKQCRDRYLNHLDPHAVHNKSAWSEEEDRILLKFIKKHGTRWRLMQATVLPKRTELTIKNRWNSAMKRRYTRFLSKRWGVDEDSIRLLTTRGLLNPGVDIEQMLRVARCKMIDVAYNVGDVKSSREELVSDAPPSSADQCAQDDIALVLEKYERSADVAAPIQVRVLMGKMSEVDATHEPIGVLETTGVNSFAFLRAFLMEKYQCLAGCAFRFSVNHLGIISQKQEIDLGPIGAVLKALATGKGTTEEPFELLVVD